MLSALLISTIGTCTIVRLIGHASHKKAEMAKPPIQGIVENSQATNCSADVAAFKPSIVSTVSTIGNNHLKTPYLLLSVFLSVCLLLPKEKIRGAKKIKDKPLSTSTPLFLKNRVLII